MGGHFTHRVFLLCFMTKLFGEYVVCNLGIKGVQCKIGHYFMILDESWLIIHGRRVTGHFAMGEFFLLGDF